MHIASKLADNQPVLRKDERAALSSRVDDA
jgi:hypothetical protein